MAHISNNNRKHEEFMTEALDDNQKRKIDAMPNTNRHVKEIHDKVFGEGNDTVEIPYSREDDEKITSSNYRNVIKTGGLNSHQTHHNYVFDHLHRNGYKVTDYVKGLAVKTTDGDSSPAREEKIGKILQKTKADEAKTSVMSNTTYKRNENQDGTSSWQLDNRGNKIVDREPRPLTVAQAFTNDPIRAAKKDVKIVVTRSKEGVGGMSTGKGWTSCMDIDNGCNRHYVPHDITHGTLTAYLVKKGDEKNIDNPAGRINLKQFTTANSSHQIFRPETAVYGAMPASAHKAINNWAESVYPHKQDEVYSKHHALYDDDGKSTVITGNPEHHKIARMVDNHVSNLMAAHEERQYNAKHDDNDDFLSDHVERYLNNLPEQHKRNLVIHSRLTTHDDPSEKWEGDMGSDDHIAKWAHQRSVDWNSIHDTDLMHHLNNAEENSKYGHNYDSDMLDDATYVHHKLIKEVIRRGSPEIKDKSISHMLDNHHNDWYQNMDNQYGHEIPHLHDHTDNPANIKKIYEVSKDGNFYHTIPEFDDMDDKGKADLSRKIGKHGDDDVLHEFTHAEHYHDHYASARAFHEGLNDRKDGEERQHKLISELNLGGGHAKGNIAAITNTGELKNATLGYHRTLGHSDVGNDDLYANIAEHTKFSSVHSALKNRTDTQTPLIQASLKDNKNINK